MLPCSSRHLPWWKSAVSWLKRWCLFYFYSSWAKTFIKVFLCLGLLGSWRTVQEYSVSTPLTAWCFPQFTDVTSQPNILMERWYGVYHNARPHRGFLQQLQTPAHQPRLKRNRQDRETISLAHQLNLQKNYHIKQMAQNLTLIDKFLFPDNIVKYCSFSCSCCCVTFSIRFKIKQKSSYSGNHFLFSADVSPTYSFSPTLALWHLELLNYLLFDLVVEEVELVYATPQYAHVRLPSGRETTVPWGTSHLLGSGVWVLAWWWTRACFGRTVCHQWRSFRSPIRSSSRAGRSIFRNAFAQDLWWSKRLQSKGERRQREWSRPCA